jgi:DNA-directed RNA polymerase beta' subunit
MEPLKKYSCECGNTTGKFRFGDICPHCNTVVKFIDDELNKTGWMELKEPYVIINPRMYKFLEVVFKAKRLDEMIRFERKLDMHGVLRNDTGDSKNPYANIGIVEFANNFDIILENLGDKKRILETRFINENRDKIFSRHIPVISLLLRPVVMINNSTFNYDPLNKFYSEMVSHVCYINNNLDNDMTYINLNVLYELQKKYNELEDGILRQKINGKKRAIRGNILGSRINFSARHVLIPNVESVQIDAIVIPYLTFTEFYKFHIMNIYKKIYQVSIHELEDRWYTLVMSQDPSIMKIIDILIKQTKNGLRNYVNRNPTLSYGSTTSLKVTSIHTDIHNLTMKISLNILQSMNADFDGDALNDVALIEQNMADMFEKYYNPERMILSVSSGNFNRKCNLIKDQLCGIWSFCNDDDDVEDTMNDPDDGFTICDNGMLAAAEQFYASGGIF